MSDEPSRSQAPPMVVETPATAGRRTETTPRPRWVLWILAVAASYGLVAAVGTVAKWVIEATTEVTYELHWFTTMPLLAAAFAFVWMRRQGRAA